jgi:threonine synthase
VAGILAFASELPVGQIVCTLTGHGLKDPGTALDGIGDPEVVPATLGAVLDRLGW